MSDTPKDWLKVKYAYHCATHGWWDGKIESGCPTCIVELRRTRNLQETGISAYQRGLNDGLEQAARICEDVPFICIKGDESAVCNEACAKAIRAQIKK